jgi:adenine deaminase
MSNELERIIERIAIAQERLLAIAEEAREERKKVADAMKQHFRPGFDPGQRQG